MKYPRIVISFCALVLASSFLHGQDVPTEHTDQGDQFLMQLSPPHFGLEAARLYLDFQTGLTTTALKMKYGINDHKDVSYIPALANVTDAFDKRKFKEFQILVNSDLGDIYSIQIPMNRYKEFIKTSGIKYLELAKKVYPKLDEALLASNVNLVHQGINLSQPYSGKDVVVGIIDFGFDYTHPTFRDPGNGRLRIKKVWEQNALSGNTPEGFNYGRELIEAQAILDAETDIALSGHGTHVAGIAAGSGGSLEALYRGVAYDSDIILVSLNAREGTTGNNIGVIDGIRYIFEYAEAVGKAAVVNISQGHHTGPHDGTSLADQSIDAMSGPGKIIVGAVGNEGDASGFYLHFDHTFDNENSILSYLVWPEEISAGEALVDIWGEAGTNFQVGFEVFNPHTETLEVAGEILTSENPVAFVSGKLVDLEGDTIYYEGGIEINPLNSRPHAQFYIDNTAQANGVNFDNLLDNDFIQIKFEADRGTVHAYAANNSGEAFFTDLSGIGAKEFIEGIRVRGGNPTSTMGELGGTARSIISVGGYTTKNSFTNTLGEKFAIEDVVGAEYFRSSQGPTLDGRIKPDISAPANLIAAAENSFYTDFDASLSVGKIDKGDGSEWNFSIRRGTSAAAPMVAGVVALMLEADPQLTPEKAKETLTANAQQDEFTGTVPNNIWGYGKVDAAGVMTSLDQPTSTSTNFISKSSNIFPNPTRGHIHVESILIGQLKVHLIDFAGRSVFTKEIYNATGRFRIDLPDLINGVYSLHLKQQEMVSRSRLVILH